MRNISASAASAAAPLNTSANGETSIPSFSSFANTHGCFCFSLCAAADVEEFVSLRPSTIDSTDSPWFGYLQQVYGKHVKLPFALDKLNFFYSRDESWPEHVEWPMGTCGQMHGGNFGPPQAMARDHYRTNNFVKCSANRCARWYREVKEPKRHFSFVIFPNGPLKVRQTSRGTAFYEMPRDGDVVWNETSNANEEQNIAKASRLLGHEIAENNTWVEVMRMNERVMPKLLFQYNGFGTREGELNYGCWIYPVRGSGIWINVGQTWVNFDKDHQKRLDRMLTSEQLNATPPDIGSGHRIFETYPKRAALLGFDTVQVQFKSLAPRRKEFYGELVVLKKPDCMTRRQSGLKPLDTCLPFLDMRVGPDPSTVEHVHHCVCSENASFSLNCAERAGHFSGAQTLWAYRINSNGTRINQTQNLHGIAL